LAVLCVLFLMRLKILLRLSYHSREATWNDLETAGLFLNSCLRNAVASLLLEQVIKNGIYDWYSDIVRGTPIIKIKKYTIKIKSDCVFK
jgi:hypothetical protein